MFTSTTVIDATEKILLRSLSIDTGLSLLTVSNTPGFTVSALKLYTDVKTSVVLYDGALKIRTLLFNSTTLELEEVTDLDLPAGSTVDLLAVSGLNSKACIMVRVGTSILFV